MISIPSRREKCHPHHVGHKEHKIRCKMRRHSSSTRKLSHVKIIIIRHYCCQHCDNVQYISTNVDSSAHTWHESCRQPTQIQHRKLDSTLYIKNNNFPLSNVVAPLLESLRVGRLNVFHHRTDDVVLRWWIKNCFPKHISLLLAIITFFYVLTLALCAVLDTQHNFSSLCVLIGGKRNLLGLKWIGNDAGKWQEESEEASNIVFFPPLVVDVFVVVIIE